MVKKLTLIGMRNDEMRYHFIFKKEEVFSKIFYKLMEDLGFGTAIYQDFLACDKKTGEETEAKLKKFNEDILHYKNNNFDIDIFFGIKKIILVVRLKNKDLRNKLLDSLNGKYVWSKSGERIKKW